MSSSPSSSCRAVLLFLPPVILYFVPNFPLYFPSLSLPKKTPHQVTFGLFFYDTFLSIPVKHPISIDSTRFFRWLPLFCISLKEFPNCFPLVTTVSPVDFICVFVLLKDFFLFNFPSHSRSVSSAQYCRRRWPAFKYLSLHPPPPHSPCFESCYPVPPHSPKFPCLLIPPPYLCALAVRMTSSPPPPPTPFPIFSSYLYILGPIS